MRWNRCQLSVIQQALCVCQPYLVLSVNYHSLFFLIQVKTNRWEWAVSQAVCSSLPRFFMGGDTHSLCVVCLVAKHAESALEAGIYENICQCVCFTFRGLRSVSMPVISRSGPTAAETRQRLRTRGSKHGSGGWVGDGFALSPPVFPRSSGFRTTGSDGGCAQRGYFWPAVHEIPRVVAQDQGVLP